MQDKELLSRMLGIEEPWYIREVNLDLEAKRLEVEVECRKTEWADEQGRKLWLHGYEERQWRHLDAFQFETIIRARVPRLRYPAEQSDDDENDEGSGSAVRGRTELVPVSWAEKGGRFTLLFESFAIEVLLAVRSISEGARLLRVSWDQAHHILERAVERGLARREVETVETLAIDEKSFGRGQKYVSVLCDPQGERVLDVEPGRDTEAACKLLQTMPAAQRTAVKAVSMDMSAAFEAAVRKQLPQAAIVYDRFHVSKLLGEAVDRTRREENRQLLARGDEWLKGTRYLWLQAPENMSAERLQCFDAAARRATATARAWEMKELFSIFWDEASRAEAQSFFTRWHQRVKRRRGIAAIKRAAQTLERHLPGLLNYIEYRITNAFAEGINSLIHALKSASRGFRNFANFRTRILFFFGKLSLLPVIPSNR